MKDLKILSPISIVKSVSEVRPDKNGNDYKLLRLQGLNETEETYGGKTYTVRSRGKEVSITQYKESYLDGTQDEFYDAVPGEPIGVEIYQAITKPYDIMDDETGEVREVTSYSFPVIRGENPLSILKRAGRELRGTSNVEAALMAEEAEEASSITA